MSTPNEVRNEIDEEPEEGEIQDDEGSLEDVSSDDEIAPLAKRRERTCTLVTVRGQFVKTEKKQIIRSPRREMRLCPSERSDVSLKKCQIRVKAGCRTVGVSDSYYESVLRHKSLKEHSQKVSGKMHEKENKGKESKKGRRRSTSFHGGGDLRNTYIGSEHAESYFSSTSSKGPWHKGDIKEKHKKKKKSSKSNKVSNPLGEVSAGQRKIESIIESVKPGENAKEEPTQNVTQKEPEAEKEKPQPSPSSPSSDIQILDVPVVVPEIITICDSDEEVLKNGSDNCNINLSSTQKVLKNESGNCNINLTSIQKEGDVYDIQLPPDPRPSPLREVVEESCEDPDDNLKLLREAALNSSKSDTSININRDDEVLQLRLAALRSAIIRKYEERKKKGITLAKTNRNVGDKQAMSISPLGSPNYGDEVDQDLSSPFEFNMSSNHGESEPANDSEVDKITSIDMELAESDEEKEQVCTESGYADCGILEDKLSNNNSDSCKADEKHRDDSSNIIYSINEPLVPAVPQDCSPSTPFTTVCAVDPPAGYIIGDQDPEQSSFEIEIPNILTQPLNCLLKPQPDIVENSGNVERLDGENQIPSLDHIIEVSNCEHIPDRLHENVIECCLSEEVSSKSFQPLETSDTIEFVSTESRNNEPLDIISSRSDCSFLSPVSRELDLDSMIVLDEVGKSSDEARSECSMEDVPSSEKLANTLYEERENISENCYNENVPELYEENCGINLSNLICNSRSSSENVPIFSDNFEATQDISDMFEKNSDVHLYDETNSRSPDSEIVQNSSENFETCVDTLKNVTDFSLKILSSDTQVSNDLPSHEIINKDLQMEVCDKGSSDVICKLSNLSPNSVNGTEMRDHEAHSQSVRITGNVDNSENLIKFSSEENEGFLGLVDDEAAGCSKSILKSELSPAGEEKHIDLLNDKNIVHEPCCPSSLDQLQQTDHMILTNNMSSGESISNIQEAGAEDDEIVLRDSLLAMLKKRTKEPSKSDDLVAIQNGGTVPVDNGTSRNVLPLLPETTSLKEKSKPDTLHKNDNKNNDNDLLLKHVSICNSLKASPPLVKSLPKHVYPLRNLTSINMPGAKGNKIRHREAKVHGIFNVNVPKLVIHLGEDSDSNEDENEHITVRSNSNGSDVSEESRENTSGSQSVPPDFEKKLDLLLKQARFQQETSTKDDKDNSNENPNSSASVNKVIILPSTNSNIDLEKNSKSVSISIGSPNTRLLSSSKISPLVIRGTNNQRAKNVSFNTVTRNKMMLSGKNVNVSRTSIAKAIDANKKDIQDKIKNPSAIANPTSSVSSVVDIGLLPSSKQEEYIRLKRQLAQLARKEQEVKAKENVTLVNSARLPVRKEGMEENKVASPDIRNSIIKNSVAINTERSPFTRKFVRRGQGGTIIARTDFSKSKRVVRAITSSYNSQAHSRNRLTVTTPNRIGISPLEGPSIVRHVLCLPQKRIVSTLTNMKKVTPGFQITVPSVSFCASDIQGELANLVRKSSEERVSVVDAPLLQSDVVRTRNSTQEKQTIESSVQAGGKVTKKCIVKSVLKRKASASDINGVLRKKLSNEQKGSREENKSESSLANSHLKDNHSSDTNECSTRLGGIVHIGENTCLSKRKRSNSEQSGVTLKKKFVVHESSDQQAIPNVNCNCADKTKTVVNDRTLAEDLWDSESKLISKRYKVLEDIASVQLNLHEIEKVSELREDIIRDIKRLQQEMNLAEAQLSKKEELLKVLYSEVEIAKRDIMRKQSETLLLSVECEEMGGKVHGSNYSVPNTCTDLIRKGMATISKTLQQMTDKKQAAESECEIPAVYQSDEAVLKENSTVQVKPSEIAETGEKKENINTEDSSKQNSGSYLSPLDAMRTATEPNNDNQAVLCPYHIMGSCKDKECSYLH